ncbi:MAG: Lrp/AsnC family transcriptional regulator [Propionicimonas sp.]|uniref:Lrp/AsnC family transcriptional regulator n=1 Tax=Propionicimonas sp. TaxID=1955623 RepID=UPI002B20DB46|nr:Lrp/AsnC family transcriptional regulator [Propionicimonas sp.]MEA4943555.1 Lrp/AsnC family transcriptional regulator [Propionicimonas sp.]
MTSKPPGRLNDRVDATIVRELMADGRATLARLAELTGLSTSGIKTRVRRLEERGIITGYRAEVDHEAIGVPLSAFMEVTPLDASALDTIPEQLEHLREIEACHSVAGDASYILFVRVPTPRRLEELIREIRQAANVNTRTTVVLQTFFADRPPLVRDGTGL